MALRAQDGRPLANRVRSAAAVPAGVRRDVSQLAPVVAIEPPLYSRVVSGMRLWSCEKGCAKLYLALLF